MINLSAKMVISQSLKYSSCFCVREKCKSKPHYSSHYSSLPPFIFLLVLTLWTQTRKYNCLYRFDLEGLSLTSENQTKL